VVKKLNRYRYCLGSGSDEDRGTEPGDWFEVKSWKAKFPLLPRTITTTHYEYANTTTREEMEIQMQTAITLDCRGVRMSIERADLTELPESCLLVLFPNGVVLSSPRQLLTADDQEDREEDIYYVDVSQSFPPLNAPCQIHCLFLG
jgi:hypothetical protein